MINVESEDTRVDICRWVGRCWRVEERRVSLSREDRGWERGERGERVFVRAKVIEASGSDTCTIKDGAQSQEETEIGSKKGSWNMVE